jgi:hypothetical protein
MIPGARIMDAVGRDDRREAAFVVEDDFSRAEIFVEAARGQFAGERSTLAHDTRELRSGTVTTSTVVRIMIVDGIGELPFSE